MNMGKATCSSCYGVGFICLILCCNTCFGITATLNNVASEWNWGPQYIPSGRDPVYLRFEVHNVTTPYVSAIFPYYSLSELLTDPGPLESRLIEANGVAVSFDESDDPIFDYTGGDFYFTFEIKPADGHTWPQTTFRLIAGGSEAADPSDGVTAVTAIGVGFRFQDPREIHPIGEFRSAYIVESDFSGRWGDPLVIVGKNYAAGSLPIPSALKPGIWVKEGDLVEIVANDQLAALRLLDWPAASYFFFDGNGIDDYPQWRNAGFPELPTFALQAGVIDQNGSVTYFGSDGFVGAGRHLMTAPATGFLGINLNASVNNNDPFVLNAIGGITPFFDVEARVIPEPSSIVLAPLGIMVINRRKKCCGVERG